MICVLKTFKPLNVSSNYIKTFYDINTCKIASNLLPQTEEKNLFLPSPYALGFWIIGIMERHVYVKTNLASFFTGGMSYMLHRTLTCLYMHFIDLIPFHYVF